MSSNPAEPFEIVTTAMGAVSIRDNTRGEILHNPAGPMKEAMELYVKPSRLAKRLKENTEEPVVLWDVGLGAGFNTMAAIKTLRELSDPVRPLFIVSFENDFRLFDFAIDNLTMFEGFAAFKEELEELQHQRILRRPRLHWEIVGGDFQSSVDMNLPAPEIIFFDPFSPKTNREMWSLEVFAGLYRQAKRSNHPCTLCTYSMSTGIRAGLFLAGFFVGVGPKSGPKAETTIAATVLDELQKPLNSRWLERWRRSAHPLPPGCDMAMDEAARRLSEHPQFI